MSNEILTKTDNGLEGLVSLTNDIIKMHEVSGQTDALQSKIQELLFRAATDVDVSGLADITSEQFSQALKEMRAHVFVRPEGTHYANGAGTPGVRDFAEAAVIMAEATANSLRWPPVLPQIAVVIGLVRAVIRCGIRIDMSHDVAVDFDFAPYMSKFSVAPRNLNGWSAFFVIYGDLILSA